MITPSSRIEPLEQRIAPSTLLGLDGANDLLRFNSTSPGTIAATTPVSGLGAGETLVGIDFRPATGQLYGVSIDAGDVGHLYAIHPATGAATLAATLAADPGDATAPYAGLSGASFGLDFDPVADRLRVVSDTQQNLRVDPSTGLVTTDADLNPGAPAVSGAAYTNSYPGATTTTLFDIDTASDSLVVPSSPDNGTLTTIGSLGIGDVTGVAGFDLGQGKNEAFAALTVGGATQLFSINLTTGAATTAGNIGSGATALRGLTVLSNTWSGGGADDRTLSGANWVSGLAPAAGDALLFPAGAARFTVESNHPSGTTFNTVRFTGAGYTLAPFLAAKTSDGFRLNFNSGTVTVNAEWTFASSSGPSVIEVTQAGATLALNAGLISDAGLDFTGAGRVQLADLSDSSATGAVTINGPAVTVAGTGWQKATIVQSGALVVNGVFASALVTLQGGTLSGTGRAVEIAATGGILKSGASSLALEAHLTVAAGATAQFDLPAAGGFAPLLVPGTVTLGGALTVNAPGIIPAQFILIDHGGDDAVSGTFAGLAEGAPFTIGADTFAISYAGGDGNDVTLTRTSGRNAPTTLTAKTATFTDVDGDLVTVAITKGTLTAQNFILRDLGGGRSQLELIDFRGDATFADTNLTVTAKRNLAAGGDGSVNVGYVHATGLDLGLVKIAGDLAALDAGDATPTDSALKGLNVQSLGVLGFFTGAADLHSDLNGKVETLTIRGEVRDATVFVFDSDSDFGASSGSGNAIIGTLTVGGSLVGGARPDSGVIEARDAILAARIAGSIRGGDGAHSGAVIGLDKLGSLTVGGSLIGGAGESSGRVQGGATGSVQVKGSIEGGAGAHSGMAAFAALGSLGVNGSVSGGDGVLSGRIAAFTAMTIRITHDLRGGAGENSGSVEVDGAIGTLTVGGSLIGGAGDVSGSIINGLDAIGALQIRGSIFGGKGIASGFISGFAVTSLTVGGSLFGGAGVKSARIEPFSLTTVKIGGSLYGVAALSASLFSSTSYSVTIGGSVFGGAAESGQLVGYDGFTAIRIGGDLRGGPGADSGSIQSFGNLPALTLGGSLFAGSAARSGAVLVAQALGAVTIGGGIFGSAAQPAIISALGSAAPGGGVDLALKSLSVKGGVHFAKILAGYDTMIVAKNADAQIGAISVGGDWLASSVAAGVSDVAADGFGNADDAKISGVGTTDDLAIHSKIGSIVIKGQAFGTSAEGDHFGFVAQEIGALTMGAVKYPLIAQPFNDDLDANDPRLLLGPTGDLRVHEVAE